MNRNELIETLQHTYRNEESRIQVDIHKAQKMALVYPNTYFVGMSNLGLHIIYEEVNTLASTVCERVFLPTPKELKDYEKHRLPLMSLESQRPLDQFDVIGIDITFEMDYVHIPMMLKMGRVPVLAKHRIERDPIVIGGGPCATFNPEPMADFFDAFIIGEGEVLTCKVVEKIYELRQEGASRKAILLELAQMEGVYVPSLYEPQFDEMGRFTGYTIDREAPERIRRHWQSLTGGGETVVATDFTEFGAMYIVEVARGCGRHCRFCMAGYCYRTPRIRPLEELKRGVDRGLALGKKIGLMGAAISDYPYIDDLIRYIRSAGGRFSCASLRADSLTTDIVEGLAESGQKTITIAPEAGSDRLRRVINKGITNEDLQTSIRFAARAGIPNIRLYIMVGLPTETMEDIDAIISMAETMQQYMAEEGCKGRLTLSVNPFIPKPFTPFQWEPMADEKEVKKKLEYIKKSLRKNQKIEVLVESPKEAYMQGVLARGDRRLGAVLAKCAEERGMKSFKEALRVAAIDMNEALYEPLAQGRVLPWSHLDMGLREGYLEQELQRGIQESYTAPCQEGCKRCGVCE